MRKDGCLPLPLHLRAMAASSVQRAAFATTARLLSCLVTESLVRAIFTPLPWSDCVGIGVISSEPVSTDPARNDKSDSQGDVLAIVLLRHVPVFKPDSSDPRGKEIGLLDPLDMFPLVLVTSGDGDSDGNEVRLVRCLMAFPVFALSVSRSRCPPQLHQPDLLSAIQRVFSKHGWFSPFPAVPRIMNDPLILWEKFANSIDLDPATRSAISDELESSVRWQAYSYDHPPNAPMLLSPSIDWEQSIVEGHPTHPVRVPSVLTSSRQLTDGRLDAQDTPILAPDSLYFSRKL
jgi:hypothetical protein